MAQGCWQAVQISWLRFDVRPGDVSRYAGYCMARKPPPFFYLGHYYNGCSAHLVILWRQMLFSGSASGRPCAPSVRRPYDSAIGLLTCSNNYHFRRVSESFARMAFGNYERYRHESAGLYIQGCMASVYGSTLGNSTPALRRPEHHIMW